MADREVLVIGQGLAGTTFAWALLLRGNPPLVMDAHTGSAASRVAAGLLAPVGGKRLSVAWRAEQAWPAALPFYRSIEAKLGVDLLEEAPVVRLFVDEQQKDEFSRRATGPLSDWAIDGDPGIGPEFYAPLGGCQVIGGRLDVDRYLDASRAEFARLGLLIDRNLDDPGELDESSAGVSLRASDLTVSHVVLCRGLAEQGFCPLPFEPAKGETLTVRAPRLSEQRVVQRGVWLAPLGENLFRVGATFDRCSNDQKPTVKGRQELEAKLNDFIRVPYAVVDHSAGVRPILKSRRPIAGLLPGRTRIGVLNGLGASGSLWAPWVAGQYAQHLLFGEPLDSEVDASVRLANCR